MAKKTYTKSDLRTIARGEKWIIERAKWISEQLAALSYMLDMEDDVINPGDLKECTYFVISEFCLDAARPFIEFTGIDVETDERHITEMPVDLLLKSDDQINRMVKKAERKMREITTK